MRESGLDALFILQNTDLYYFSGTIQVGLLCIPAEGEPIYLVQKSLSRARQESPLERLVGIRSLRKAPEILATEGIHDLRKVGLEMDVIPAGHYLRLKEIFTAAEFVDFSEDIRRLRMVKSAHEVAQIRRAAEMLNLAFKEIPGWMRPGATELEISANLESLLRRLGHQGLVRMRGFNYEISYGTVSIGSNACQPTFFPGPVGFMGLYPAVPNGGSNFRLKPGDTLMADIVGGYGGYIADKTRTFSMGEPPTDMEAAHTLILEMLEEIEDMLKPGMSCERLWDYSLERVKDSPCAVGYMGLGDSQVRFLGHGVGLELDELPVLAKDSAIVLEPGMTLAVEPKIFFPGRGGVGVENTYLITESGCENLTPFPEKIIRA
jgi:Xaa-Pro aminopeptidase